MVDRQLKARFRSFSRPLGLVLAAILALLPSPAVALDEGPYAPFVLPLRREVTPVHHKGRLISFKTSYSGLVHVGSPEPMQLRMVFDTGSGHVVVPSTRCRARACLSKARYDPGKSATSTTMNLDGSTTQRAVYDTITIGYGRGEVRGFLHRDLVCLGPVPATGEGNATSTDSCAQSGIVTAYNMSSNPFENFTFDGIVGLSLKGLAVAEHFSFLRNLAGQNGSRFSSGQFGVFLAEGDDEEESEIAFGGHNPAHLLEPLMWVPLAKPETGYWMVEILGLYVDEVRLDVCSQGPCTGILDTGTSHLGVPRAHLATLARLLERPAGGLSDCRRVAAPALKVELRGHNLTLLPENYMRRLPLNSDVFVLEAPVANRTVGANGTAATGTAANGTAANGTARASAPHPACTAKLMAVALPQVGPEAFLLGEPALHRYYTVYDTKALRAGFGLAARRKRAPEPEEEEVNHDEIFLMQQMRGAGPARKQVA